MREAGRCAARLHQVKRGHRAYPKGITEIAPTRPDPRADPQATQKISREQLDEALKRTKSGTRPIVRSEPAIEEELFSGPRDDAPQITITKIESMEFEAIDPSTLPRPPTPLASLDTSIEASNAPTPRHRSSTLTQRLRSSPQIAIFAGLAIVAFITLAAVIGFFAGRITGH